jgi:hypothetical protein
MLRKTIAAAAIAAMSLTTLVPTTAAFAHGKDRYERGYKHGNYRNAEYRGDRYYRGDDRYSRGNRYYRGDNRNYGGGRYYANCRRDSGTGGLVIGAIAGGLLGNEVAGRRGDRTAGTVIGAGVGALAGRAIDRSDSRC